MATKFTFGNEVVKLPGSYSRFTSGVTNPPLALSYGNVLLIDTGIGAGYGAGAGIAGELADGADAVYAVDNLADFRNAVGGGILWDIAANLFQPNGAGGGEGASTIFYLRAATTVPAQATITFTGGGANGGVITLKAKNEGDVGNGILGDETLSSTTATPFEVTAAGAATDTHTLTVDDPKNGVVTIASYTVLGGESVGDIATLLAATVTAGATGYKAIASGAEVIVSARASEGDEVASDFDGITTTYDVTGTATGTTGAFAGGVDGSSLTLGYGIQMSKGVDDTSAFVVQLYRGTFKGVDANGYVWDEIDEVNSRAVLVSTSPEFTNISELIKFMNTNTTFGSVFKLASSTVSGDGSVDAADLAANANWNLFYGGTAVYDTTLVDTALEHIQASDYSLVLADGYEDNSESVNNGKILAHIAEAETFGDKMMIIGGGADSNSFAKGTTNSSIDTAAYYNNDRVVVCHGGTIKTTTAVADGFINQTSLHKAASICGRIAGLAPQIPVTFKTINIDGERHKLSTKEQRQGLDAGVLMTKADGSFFRCVQGVSTIQENDYLINSDATTHSIQLRRMIAQVNKEIVVNATNQLLKKPDGTNRNTLKASDVKNFVQTYLKGRTATATNDDMIISSRNVVVTLDNDAYKCTYDVIFNTEVTKLFFTGKVFLNF